MANYLKKSFNNNELEFFDLQENPLPMCDGDKCYDLPELPQIGKRIAKSVNEFRKSCFSKFKFSPSDFVYVC